MFAWPRYLPRALPAVPIFSILISPKYEPALSDAMTVLPLSPTTCKRPRFTMYISLPTSPVRVDILPYEIGTGVKKRVHNVFTDRKKGTKNVIISRKKGKLRNHEMAKMSL